MQKPLFQVDRRSGKELRYYQIEAIQAIIADWNAGIRSLVSMPTGSGKTFTVTALLSEVFKPGDRVLFLVHRKELLHQAHAEFVREFNSPHKAHATFGKVQGQDNQDYGASHIVAMIQTLRYEKNLRRLLKAGEITHIVVDEAHHITADSYMSVINHIIEKCGDNVKVLGVTATPFRSDNISLGAVFEQLYELGRFTYRYGIEQALEDGHLAPFKSFELQTGLSLGRAAKLSPTSKAYQDSLTALWEAGNWADLMMEAWEEHAKDQLTLAFMPSVEISLSFIRKFGERFKVKTGHVDANGGQMYDPDQDMLIPMDRHGLNRIFGAGKVQLLSNFGIHTEGSDIPAIECVLMGRPTNSVSLYIQMAGRGLRLDPKNPKKVCTLLDVQFRGHSLITPNALTGTLPDEKEAKKIEEAVAELEGQEVEAGGGEVQGPPCLNCHQGYLVRVPSTTSYRCNSCGQIFAIEEAQPDLVDLFDPTKLNGQGVMAKPIDLLAKKTDVAWHKDGNFFSAGLGTVRSQTSNQLAARTLVICPPGSIPRYQGYYVLVNVVKPVTSSERMGGRWNTWYKYTYGKPTHQILMYASSPQTLFEYGVEVAEKLSEPNLANRDRKWRKDPISPGQARKLKGYGVNPALVPNKGVASRTIEHKEAMKYIHQNLINQGEQIEL